MWRNLPREPSQQKPARSKRNPNAVCAMCASCEDHVQVMPPGSASGSRPRWDEVFGPNRTWIICIFWTIAKIRTCTAPVYFSGSLLREVPKDSQAQCRRSAWHQPSFHSPSLQEAGREGEVSISVCKKSQNANPARSADLATFSTHWTWLGPLRTLCDIAQPAVQVSMYSSATCTQPDSWRAVRLHAMKTRGNFIPFRQIDNVRQQIITWVPCW